MIPAALLKSMLPKSINLRVQTAQDGTVTTLWIDSADNGKPIATIQITRVAQIDAPQTGLPNSDFRVEFKLTEEL